MFSKKSAMYKRISVLVVLALVLSSVLAAVPAGAAVKDRVYRIAVDYESTMNQYDSQTITAKGYYSKDGDLEDVYYKFEVKAPKTSKYVLAQDWDTNGEFEFTPEVDGTWYVKAYAVSCSDYEKYEGKKYYKYALKRIVVKKATTPPPAADTEKPVITLKGSASVELYVGDTWTDPGATVTDNVDKDLTATVTGTVDTSKAGTYELTYTAKDKAGNAADPVKRTVVVKEKEIKVESVSAINATTVEVVLATAPAADLTSNDISKLPVLVNGSPITPTAITKVTTDTTGKTYRLTIPSLANTEGSITVSGTAPATKVAPGSDFDFDFKAPTATVQVVDANHLKVVFSEKVSKTQAETVSDNYVIRKISNNVDDAPPAAAKLDTDGKTVNLTLATALVPASYVLKLNTATPVDDIRDLAGNLLAAGTEISFTGVATADTTKPQALSASYNPSAGTLTITFNEAMSTTTFVKTGFTLSNGTNSATLGVNETGAWSLGNTVLTITLSSSKKAEVDALGSNLTLSIAADSVKDAALNGIDTVSNQAVSAATILSAASYDEATNVLTLTFSKPVNVGTFVKSEFTLDGMGGARALGASDNVTTSENGTIVKVAVAKNALLDTYEGAGITNRNVDFSAASGTFVDINGVAVAATSNVPLTYVEDTTKPTLVSAAFNKSNNRLTLTFSEPIQVDNALNAYQITNANIHFTVGAFALTATECETDTADGVATSASTVVFNDAANTLTDASKIYFDANAVRDDAGNQMDAVTQANAIAIAYTDQTPPTVNNTATQVSANTVTLTFSEALDKTSAETVANYTIAKNDNPTVTLNVLSAKLNGAGTGVTLTVSPAGTIGYVYNIKVSNVKDRYNNTIRNANAAGVDIATWTVTAVNDTTGPSLAGVVPIYTDVDGSKSITAGDTIELIFDEVLNVDFSKITTTDYTITGGRNLGTSPTFTYGSGYDRVKITLGANPTIRFGDTITPAAGNDFKDLAGNSAQAVASGALANPGTAPRISTITYADTNASGAVDAGDKVTITYDRNITLPNGIAGIGAPDFTLAGGLNFGATPTFELQNNNKIIVTLGGAGIAVDAAVGTDDTIDEAASADIADEWGVIQLAADGTAATVTSADRTNPIITSVAITKGTGNSGNTLEAGDTVTITMSEPVHKGTFTAGEFALFTGATQLTYTGATANVAVNGNRVTITIAVGDGWVGTPLAGITTFNFTGAAATVQDASGNFAAPSAGFGVSVTKP